MVKRREEKKYQIFSSPDLFFAKTKQQGLDSLALVLLQIRNLNVSVSLTLLGPNSTGRKVKRELDACMDRNGNGKFELEMQK